MKNQSRLITAALTLILGIIVIGCDKEENPSGPGTGPGTGLFKTAGTFSFSSNRGNFSVSGVFDTLFTSANAAGAFQYTEQGANMIIVYAYDMRDTSNMRVVFAGVVDTLNPIAAGAFSFADVDSARYGIFGYMSDIADFSNSSFYVLVDGSISITTLTTSVVTGSFSGNGVDAFDTLNTIAVANGSFNTPIVEKYFGYGRDDEGLVQERIQAMVRRELYK